MIQFSVTGFDGAVTALSEVTQWELCRTDGMECDSFRVRFRFDAALRQPLYNAVFFSAAEEGSPLFSGIVDQAEIETCSEGMYCVLQGRGMGGVLEDHEAPRREYAGVRAAQLLATYVTPLGIAASSSVSTACALTVPLGRNYLRILQDYCHAAGALPPRFLADGTLCITAERETSGLQCTEQNVIQATVCYGRKGVLSEVRVYDGETATIYRNEAFLAEGGRCLRCFRTSDAQPSPQVRIRSSMRQRLTLCLCMPGTALAEPGSTVSVVLPGLGIDQPFYVTKCRSTCDADGHRCELFLSGY